MCNTSLIQENTASLPQCCCNTWQRLRQCSSITTAVARLVFAELLSSGHRDVILSNFPFFIYMKLFKNVLKWFCWVWNVRKIISQCLYNPITSCINVLFWSVFWTEKWQINLYCRLKCCFCVKLVKKKIKSQIYRSFLACFENSLFFLSLRLHIPLIDFFQKWNVKGLSASYKLLAVSVFSYNLRYIVLTRTRILALTTQIYVISCAAIPAVRLTCIACFSRISQSILNRKDYFRVTRRLPWNFHKKILCSSKVRPFDMW